MRSSEGSSAEGTSNNPTHRMKTKFLSFYLVAAALLSCVATSLLFSASGVETPKKEDREKREGGGENPYEALRFRRLQLQDEHGRIPPNRWQKALAQIKAMKAAQEERLKLRKQRGDSTLDSAGISPGNWASFGPGHAGGRILSVASDPSDPNSIWVGSASGGIWHTTDAGAFWQPVNDFMPSLAISSMIMNPVDPNRIYAGTGEATAGGGQGGFDGNYGVEGAGILRSTDRGATWDLPTGSTPLQNVNRLEITPDGGEIFAATSTGIWASLDGGTSWTPKTTGFWHDVVLKPGTYDQLIASGVTYPGGTVTARVWYSDDGGTTWQTANFLDGGGNPISLQGVDRIELAYFPLTLFGGQTRIYASINRNNGELYSSADAGRNYTLKNTGTNYFLGGGNQGGYDNAVWVNPANPDFVIVGGIGLWRSTDGGSTLTPIVSSIHPDQHIIFPHPWFNNTSNRVVYIGNDGGFFRVDDIANSSPSFTDLNNELVVTQFYGVAIASNYGNGGLMIGGTQDNGTWLYDPLYGGFPNPTWLHVNTADGGYAAIDQTDYTYRYCETQEMGIDRYIGTTFTQITNGLTDSGSCPSGVCANYIPPFILDPNDQGTMLAGGVRLWRSRDIKTASDPSWAIIKAPVTDDNGVYIPISAIAVDPSTPNLIVVGHNKGNIYLTFNGTSDSPGWTRISIPGTTPDRFVTRLVFDGSTSPHWIYATYGGFNDDNIYRTTDFGSTWTRVTGSMTTALPSVPVRTLAINPYMHDWIYAGTEAGIFASEDGGTTWSIPQDGPANVSVDELIWQNGLYLVAATHGRGIYKTIHPPLPSCGNANTGPDTCLSSPPPPPTGPNWDERGNWPNCSVPAATDDVYIGCGMTVRAGTACRNLTVAQGATLTINANFYVLGNLTNNGTIIINQPEALYIAGNMTNDGTFSGDGQIAMYGNSGVHHFSGSGNFIGFWVSDGHSVILDSDLTVASGQVLIGQSGGTQSSLVLSNHNLTFNGSNFYNSSILDLGTGNLTLNNTGLFQTYDGGSSCCNAYNVLGTGTIIVQPSDGSLDLYISSTRTNTFQPSLHIVSGTINANVGETIGGSFTVNAGATFDIQSAGLMAVNGDMTINGAITNSNGSNPPFSFNGGTLTNDGSFVTGFFGLDANSVPLTQTISGSGTWNGISFQVYNGSTATLNNDVTLNFTQFFPSAGFSPGGHVLTYTGQTFGGSVGGTGLIKLQPSSGSMTMNSFAGINIASAVELVSGTFNVSSTFFNGPLTIDAGATVSNSAFGATANVTNNGTITSSNISFQGGTFINNGTINSTYVNFNAPFASPIAQSLGGTGAWTGTGSGYLLINDSSVTTLLNDLTYSGAYLAVYGLLNTGAFTLTAPCTVPLDTYGPSDILGNIRRTNLGACSGAVAYGNALTTIRFFGTPPTSVTVNITLGSPASFPNAVQRTYLITPTADGDYVANLRLHYQDSELNGNSESTMQLFRFDGTNWSAQGVSDRNTSDNWVEYDGVTAFSPWTISSLTPPLPSPTPSSTPMVTPTPTPSASPTPTPSLITISGTITYCSNPVPGPVPNVTLTLTGSSSGSTLSDSSGNYQFSSLTAGGNYTVTPSESPIPPGSPGSNINTVDVVATQRHFLNLGTPLSGCRLTGADVNGDSSVNTVDVVAIQRFFLGLSTGIANVGKYKFNPVSRSYAGVTNNQMGQNYDSLVFGDVASSFVHQPEGNLADEAAKTDRIDRANGTVTTVALPNVGSGLTTAVLVSEIDENLRLIGFQGDFSFDERMVRFDDEPVAKAGLTRGNWNVSGNVLSGPGPIKTLRISAFSNDFTPLAGLGTLFELRLAKVSQTAAKGTQLLWAAPPDDFIFIDSELNIHRPDAAVNGSVGAERK